jgi:hypothetical protein
MPMDRAKHIERSVDSLGRLLSVVVGIALTIAMRRILFESGEKIWAWYDPDTMTYPLWEAFVRMLPATLAFLSAIVPFYHGMTRHLDYVYLDNPLHPSKAGFLVFDFFVFFVESFVLVALAALINAGNEFYLILAILLGLDAIWGFLSHGIHYGEIKPSTIRWGIINSAAVAFILVFYFLEHVPS